MFVLNFIKLSAAVREASCWQKLIDDAENDTAVSSASNSNLCVHTTTNVWNPYNECWNIYKIVSISLYLANIVMISWGNWYSDNSLRRTTNGQKIALLYSIEILRMASRSKHNTKKMVRWRQVSMSQH